MTKDEEKVEIDVIQSYIDDLRLKMKPVKVEFIGEDKDKKFFVYFVAKKRVDFNKLVKRLYARYRCRIELRQISPREHAIVIGEGINICPNSKIPCFRPWCMSHRLGGCHYDGPPSCSDCKEKCYERTS